MLGVGLTVLLCAGVGFVTTIELNVTLGRTGRFASERLLDYVGYGARAVIACLINISLALLLFAAIALTARVIGVIVPPVGRSVERGQMAARTRIEQTDLMAQALFLVALASLVAICWTFRDLLVGFAASADRAPTADLVILSSAYKLTHLLYAMSLDVLLLIVIAGLLVLRRVSLRHSRRLPFAPVAGSLGVLSFALLLVVAPWRLVWNDAFERALWKGQDCFIIGQNAGDALIHCPGAVPPRNTVVRGGDPNLAPTGTVANLFDAIAGHSAR